MQMERPLRPQAPEAKDFSHKWERGDDHAITPKDGMKSDSEHKSDKAKFKDFKEGKEAMSVLIKKYETTRDF